METVTYNQNKKHAWFNGVKFCEDDSTGYYLNSNILLRLHRAVWEFYNGSIPDEMAVHHKDRDKSDNDISNLELMSKHEHMKLHGEMLTDEERRKLKQNMIDNAIPAASLWHKSNAGREWHKEHYEKMKSKLHETETHICMQCGSEFETQKKPCNRFCSNACKSAYRRKSGIDNETRKCFVCGKEFTVNKYSKTKTCSRQCADGLRFCKSKGDKIHWQSRCLQHGG